MRRFRFHADFLHFGFLFLFYSPGLFFEGKALFLLQSLFLLAAPLEIGHVYLNRMPATSAFLLSIVDTNLDESTELLGSIKRTYLLFGLGYDIRSNRYDESVPDKAPSMYTGNRNDGRGRVYWSESDNKNYLFNAVANYAKDINDKNRVNVMAGYEWQRFWYHNDSETIVKDVADNSVPDEDHLYLLSFFGRLNYSFAQKLLLTATLRADAKKFFHRNDCMIINF